MNHAELDRRLCERLGIAPSDPSRHRYDRRHCFHCGGVRDLSAPLDERCPAREDGYPALSSTGEGMLTLMDYLRFYGYFAQIVARDKRFTARIGASIFAGNVGHVSSEVERESAPLALAIAAAVSLEIEIDGLVR